MTPPRALLATDLDGTLLDPEGRLPEVNVEALRRAEAEGVQVLIATGRRRSSFRPMFARLDGLRFRASLSNGAVLLGEDHQTVERLRSLSWDGLRSLGQRLRASVRGLLAVTLPPAPPPGEAEEPDALHWGEDGKIRLTRDVLDPSTQVEVDETFIRTRPLVHVALVVRTREEGVRLFAEARACFGDGVEVHTARPPRLDGILTEVVVAGGKGNAVRDLAQMLGIAPDRTAAVGDELNDEALLDAARLRYAVGGSPLALRRRDALEVARAEHGAFAEALDRLLAAIGR